MEIRELVPLVDDDIERVSKLIVETLAVDAPWVYPMTTESRATFWRNGWDGEPPRIFVGEEDGEVLVWGQLDLPERDNTHLAWTGVLVALEHRRRGLGSQMFEHLEAVSRAAGRTSIGIDGWESEGALGFAAHFGLERKSQSIQRRMYVDKVDRELLAKQLEEARSASAGYELLRVFGATPDEMVDEVVEITAAINDAPTDDLDIEDEVFSAERLRDYEETSLAVGRLYTIYARHRETGRLAGKTIVQVELERPHIGHQHDTSVVSAHRGHRLGMLLKASMVEWLAEEEPQLELIDTWNAESNDHMIGVNEQLGYEIQGRNLEFQRDLTTAG
ncbi:MAG TPA: GNAT family N-acetyltransferase [Nocardioidaceae bacterium]|nr:GNAT family N-acetyltransferase [Nocardioidaceae bacterium]